ncbi:DM13 domain-containing protein [Collimonas pratensis]|uniref:Electron transfer DM13 family protein n=1 Tax=Collimonas pratensis TaxID=279113 RepID=A0A127Q1B1_9BURK|nr:DM13 domain-containing protein [Collimonas pratensis]AMP03868.1 electron transfer DM13 family protein [Collimonas pratensis]
MKKILALLSSHLLALAIGFGAGVYFLPILTAGDGPGAAELAQAAGKAKYTAVFTKDLPGSDFLHWAQGTVAVSESAIAFEGKIAPGPDYKVYLVPEYVGSKEEFLKIKERALRVGEVKTFDRFIVDISQQRVDLSRYNTVVIWCETYSQFISAAQFR